MGHKNVFSTSKSRHKEQRFKQDIKTNCLDYSYTHTLPVWDFLVSIFDCYSVRAILGWSVVNCVGSITVILHTNRLYGP